MLLLKQITILSLNCLGFLGIIVISYGVISTLTSSLWPPLEAIANWVSQIITLIATLFIAISIYFPINNRKPDRHSKYITAPSIMICIVIALGYIAKTRNLLSVHIINGFAILALSGALFRLLSYSEWSLHEEQEETKNQTH